MSFEGQHSFPDLESVTLLLSGIRDKTFRDLDVTGRGSTGKNKGKLGHIIEESVFGYPINSDAEPDINIAGVPYEIKVTPLKYVGRGSNLRLVAKERLVIDMINYCALPSEDFDSSKFWNKSKRLIIVYYLDKRQDRKHESTIDCRIVDSFILNYPAADLQTIRDDWQLIHDKVASGQADRLSESDTNYLAACTKAASSQILTKAPSPADSSADYINAKPRAFSYKQSYMNTLIPNSVYNIRGMGSLRIEGNQSLPAFVSGKLGNYVGQTIKEIAGAVDLPVSNAKNFNELLTLRMLGTESRSVRRVEQFRAAGVTQLKTVVMYDNALPEQHMSFPSIKEEQWKELADASVTWHDSFLYRFFEENKFLIVVFRARGRRRSDSSHEEDRFKGAFLWNMPEQDIERYVQPVWCVLHELMVNRKPVHYYDRKENELPGQDFNKVCHIRSHGRDGQDKYTLPNGEAITKQSFWLDRRYIANVVTTHLNRVMDSPR